MASFADLVRFNPTAGGTTDWVYSSAVVGYQSPSTAGVVDGATYKYRAESSDLLQWEAGEGVYTASTGTLTRTRVLYNSSGTTALINFTAPPTVAIVALSEDLSRLGTPRGHIWGLTWSTVGSSAAFSVTAGEAVDSTGAVLIKLASAMSKTTTAWSAGNGGGALDIGTIAASTTYHVFLISQMSGASDILISLSPTAPQLPVGYVYFRRIASSMTSASSSWTKVIQLGDDFLLDQTFAAVQFFSSTTAPQAPAIGVPTGVQVIAKLSVVMSSVSPGTDGRAYLYSLDKSSEANGYSNINAGVNSVAGLQGLGMIEIRTNTAGQIGFVLNNANGQISIGLHGWRDDRGRSY